MEALDHDAISKILGSTIKSGGRVAFGHFPSVSATEEIQKAMRAKRAREKVSPSPSGMAVPGNGAVDSRDNAPGEEP